MKDYELLRKIYPLSMGEGGRSEKGAGETLRENGELHPV